MILNNHNKMIVLIFNIIHKLLYKKISNGLCKMLNLYVLLKTFYNSKNHINLMKKLIKFSKETLITQIKMIIRTVRIIY